MQIYAKVLQIKLFSYQYIETWKKEGLREPDVSVDSFIPPWLIQYTHNYINKAVK